MAPYGGGGLYQRAPATTARRGPLRGGTTALLGPIGSTRGVPKLIKKANMGNPHTGQLLIDGASSERAQEGD